MYYYILEEVLMKMIYKKNCKISKKYQKIILEKISYNIEKFIGILIKSL